MFKPMSHEIGDKDDSLLKVFQAFKKRKDNNE